MMPNDQYRIQNSYARHLFFCRITMKSKLHFELQKLLFLLLCFCNLQQLLAAPPSSFSLGDRYPNKDEVEVCGSIRDIITRNSGRYRKILVRNSNSDIEYLNEDSRRTTTRGNEKLNALASKVKKKWPGVKLRVILAWTDRKIYGQASLYYEGRNFYLFIYFNFWLMVNYWKHRLEF